jgi:hypothetical protein
MIFYAIYLEKDPSGTPTAIFTTPKDAIQWGFDEALFYVTMATVEIDVAEIHRTDDKKNIIWPDIPKG